MVGLGNSRRGMKSPTLLVAALVACIIVLGFNYWIASSRSMDLQNRVMDLEDRIRRAAAERGAVELKKNEFKGELQKQREQIEKIQDLHNSQMENTNKIHRDEKTMLLNNITINERVIQNLQEHLEELQKEYGKLQLDVYQFQKNQTNLQRKFAYDLSQCINQMKELKEQCDERIVEITKHGSEKPQGKEKKQFSDVSGKNNQINTQVSTFGHPEFHQRDLTKQERELEENHKFLEHSAASEVQQPTPMIKNVAELDYHKDKVYNKGTDDHVINKEEPKQEENKRSVHQGNPPPPAQPSTELKSLEHKEQNPYEAGRLPAPRSHQDTNQAEHEDEEVEREHLLNDNMQQEEQEGSKAGEFGIKRMSQDNKVVDYNLDVNEAESETDKQAALVVHPNNLNVANLEDSNMQSHLFKLQEHQQKL